MQGIALEQVVISDSFPRAVLLHQDIFPLLHTSIPLTVQIYPSSAVHRIHIMRGAHLHKKHNCT